MKPRPGAWSLAGVLGESSSASDFYIWQVRLPLCGPPVGHVILDWSERVGGGSRTYWPGDPDTSAAIRTAMERAVLDDALGQVVITPQTPAQNGSMQETTGYGYVIEGHIGNAIECMRRVERATERELRIPWVAELVDRARWTRERLEQGGADEVLARLVAWRHQTLEQLGIELAD